MNDNQFNLLDLEERASKIFAKGKVEDGVYVSGVKRHLDSITDEDARAKEAVQLLLAYHGGNTLKSKGRAQIEEAFQVLNKQTLKYLQDEGLVGFHPETIGKGVSYKERRAKVEKLIANMLRDAAEHVDGKTAAKAYFVDIDEKKKVDDIQAQNAKNKRTALYNQLVGDREGQAYETLVEQLLASKDLMHETGEDGILYKAHRSISSKKTASGREVQHLEREFTDLYDKAGRTREVGAPHLNKIVSDLGHSEALLDPNGINSANELYNALITYSRLGAEGGKKSMAAKVEKNPSYLEPTGTEGKH